MSYKDESVIPHGKYCFINSVGNDKVNFIVQIKNVLIMNIIQKDMFFVL